MKSLVGPLLLGLLGCAQVPRGVEPVKGFQLERYLGRWYEIARLDHSFERGLTNVTAEYSLRDDGGVGVVNRGFDPVRNRWKQATGRAYLVAEPDVGRLKVAFVRPFFGGYNIIELDKADYSYALVCGNTRSYLWILSRQPVLDDQIVAGLVEKARVLNFKADQLVFVNQDLKR